MDFSFLEWDSNFFQRKIGKLELNSVEEIHILPEFMNIKKKEGYELVYVFISEASFELPNEFLNKYNAKLVDTKCIYEKKVSRQLYNNDKAILIWKLGMSFEVLYDLAVQSGEYSRFRLDDNIGEYNFIKLYHTWVDNSLNKKIADDILIYQEDNRILGFVTLRYSLNKATIGLIAVDKTARHRHIGTSLFEYTEYYLTEKNINSLDVATQKANSIACAFYEKHKLALIKKTHIYHFWL